MRGGSGVLADAERAAPAAKRSDLPVRVASAVVMVAVAGLALWLGGWVLTGFVIAVMIGVFAEWARLVRMFEERMVARSLWIIAGVAYLGMAGFCALVWLAPLDGGFRPLIWVIACVVGVDVGAYFAGRTFGGPKIAPAISPSKTWSGLGGAIVGTWVVGLIGYLYYRADFASLFNLIEFGQGHEAAVRVAWRSGAEYAVFGIVTAIVAQSGDFFESWMKRRAGVKDSGHLIPGHGGLFDRADGLIAVLFVIGIVSLMWSIGH
jgi:phosphatidate cytidylyltransferase